MHIGDNLKRGTVELLLLTLLQEKDMYGYEITQELTDRSKGLFTLQEASKYTILYRLEEKGCVSSREEVVVGRRIRVYYHLEAKGAEYLAQLRQSYFSINHGIMEVLRSTGEGLKEDEIL